MFQVEYIDGAEIALDGTLLVPFVKLSLQRIDGRPHDKKVMKTDPARRQTAEKSWRNLNWTFQPIADPDGCVVKIVVKGHNRQGPHAFMGESELYLSSLPKGQSVTREVYLEDPNSLAHGQVSGRLKLRCALSEQAAKPAWR